MQPRYAFGNSTLAAWRLHQLARVFAEPMRAFLIDFTADGAGLVVDLGCGPGSTTRLIAKVLPSSRVVGLDSSETFIELARQSATKQVTFERHDFTETPFPTGPADLLFGRFVLTHMAEPETVVQTWGTQLRPGGLLLIAETEWIRTENRAFSAYLKIVEEMLAHQSQQLYVGPILERLHDTATLQRRASRVARLSVCRRDAAELFFLNIQTWKQNDYIQANCSASTIEALQQELERQTHDASLEAEIEWGLRELVFVRE